MKKAAIVIICHNDQEHIETAIQCARNQTMREIEIICVNDGSTDSTLSRMEAQARQDARIRVISQEQGGTFSARYTGIQHAEAEYFLFLDSDDQMLPDAAEILCGEMEARSADVLEFGAEIFPDEKRPPRDATLQYFQNHFVPGRPFPEQRSGKALLKACYEDQTIEWFVWNKIYRTSLLQRVTRFYEGDWINNAEDALITLLVLTCAKKYDRIDQSLYRYRIGAGMSTIKGMISDPLSIRNAGMEWRILPLAEAWTAQLSKESCGSVPDLSGFRRVILDDCFRFLLHTLPARRPELISIISGNITRETFYDELREYVFEQKKAKPEEALCAIRGTDFSASKGLSLRTIAMYYPRLYNGGVERVMALLAGLFIKMGYQVVLVTEAEPNPRDYPIPADVRRVTVPHTYEKASIRAERWKTILREEHIDLVLYHGWGDPSLMLDEMTVKSLGLPLIIYIHESIGEAYRRPEREWSQRGQGYALADRVVSLSDVDCAWWKTLGLPVEKVINPPAFPDLDRISVSDLSTHDVVWVGRLDELKQFREAFEIADLVFRKDPDFRLHIVGAAEREEQTRAIAEELSRTGRDRYVILEGMQADVKPFYQRAAVYLSTSRTEGFSMTIAESKAFGLPMVAYRLPNLDFFNPPVGAIVVPQLDRNGAAEGILRLLSDGELRGKMGMDARKSIEQYYRISLEKVWGEIFDRLMADEAPHEARKPEDTFRIGASIVLEAMEEREKNKKEAEESKFRERDQMILELRQRLYETDHTLYEVYQSNSWKIGRVMTGIPRKLKKIFRGRGE